MTSNLKEEWRKALESSEVRETDYCGIPVIEIGNACSAVERFGKAAKGVIEEINALIISSTKIKTQLETLPDPKDLIVAINAPKLYPRAEVIPNDRHRIASTRGAFK